MKGEISERVENGIPLLYFLRRKRRRKVVFEAGARISVHTHHGGVEAEYGWTFVRSCSAISEDEISERSCSSVESMKNEKMEKCEAELRDVIHSMLLSEGTGKYGLDILGVPEIAALDPTTGVLGGIDRAAYTWWRNQTMSCGRNDGILRRMAFFLGDVLSEKPDVILAGTEVFEKARKAMNETGALSEDEEASIAGMKNFMFGGAVVLHDEKCPPGRMYFLNSKYLTWYVDGGAGYRRSSFHEHPPQKGLFADIVFIGNLACTSLEKQGVMLFEDYDK